MVGIGRHGVDRPGEAGRGSIGVAGAVGGSHLEGVAAVPQGGVSLRAGAGAEAAAVQLALEGCAGLAGEAEAGVGAAARVRRLSGDGGVRSQGIDRPGVAGWGWIGVAREILGSYIEGVAAFRKPDVILWAYTRNEGLAI